MENRNIILTWFSWQFYEVPKFLFTVWNNYFSFASDFFSFTRLIKTFFAPWHRYRWAYPKGFDIKEFLYTFLSNVISRVLGAMMRVVLIIAGALFQVVVAVAGAVVFVAWLLVPFVIIAGILFVIVF